MTFSRPASVALAAALAITLGSKAAWTRGVEFPDNALFVERAEALLRAEGFATDRLTRPFGTLLFGRSGRCRVMIGEYPPNGTFSDILAVVGRSVGPLRYAWDGTVYDAPPKLVPLGEYFIQRELRRIGFEPVRRPIVAVAASDECPPRAGIDWAALAMLPR